MFVRSMCSTDILSLSRQIIQFFDN